MAVLIPVTMKTRKNSTGSEFVRRRINFIEGTGVTITMTDDSVDNEVEITLATTTPLAAITWNIDGGGSVLTTGVKYGLRVPFACTINSVTLGADVSGSIVIDIWKDTHANFPPTVADTITAAAKPTITTATNSTDTTLTGWTVAIAAGDWLYFNVDSVTTITFLSINLKVTKT